MKRPYPHMLSAWDGVPYPEPARPFLQRLVTAAYVVLGTLSVGVTLYVWMVALLLVAQ